MWSFARLDRLLGCSKPSVYPGLYGYTFFGSANVTCAGTSAFRSGKTYGLLLHTRSCAIDCCPVLLWALMTWRSRCMNFTRGRLLASGTTSFSGGLSLFVQRHIVSISYLSLCLLLCCDPGSALTVHWRCLEEKRKKNRHSFPRTQWLEVFSSKS